MLVPEKNGLAAYQSCILFVIYFMLKLLRYFLFTFLRILTHFFFCFLKIIQFFSVLSLLFLFWSLEWVITAFLTLLVIDFLLSQQIIFLFQRFKKFAKNFQRNSDSLPFWVPGNYWMLFDQIFSLSKSTFLNRENHHKVNWYACTAVFMKLLLWLINTMSIINEFCDLKYLGSLDKFSGWNVSFKQFKKLSLSRFMLKSSIKLIF